MAQDERYNGDTTILRECIEAGTLDSVPFIIANKPLMKAGTTLRQPWELAEAISHRTPHLPLDQRWTLQLLCRQEEDAPIDPNPAIQLAYDAWRADTVFEFNMCDHAIGTYGWIWCVGREADTFSQVYNGTIKALSNKLNKATAQQLSAASDASTAFINSHVAYEEGLGGTGYSGFCIQASMSEMREFLDLVNAVHQSTKSSDWPASPHADSVLNAVYRQAISGLSNEEPSSYLGTPTFTGVRDTEKLWLTYRDAAANLFHSLQPKVSLAQWRNWLTERRISQLQHLGESPEQD